MNVWIVEDEPNYRRNLRKSLELEPDIQVGHVFPSCVELFEMIRKASPPDIILMDLGLPGMSGIEGIRRLTEIPSETAVVVLTVFEEKEKVQEALRAGAAGYLLKESDGFEITQGLRDVFAERLW